MTVESAAADHLDVLVYPVADPKQQRGLKWITATVAASLWGHPVGASLNQVVVKYKSSGEEAMRIDGGAPDDTAVLVTRIEQDLARLQLDEFLATWSSSAT
ncbi:hypothetical protein [Arthrobacter sp. B1805]|uniref:hypothetical protein n=1 Tax=Arthrobacter sp. B1805 TaxID=2058892 RepID=UPI000CE39425|nr:hypothetical protein [Arthrobacter sp. B1805]